MSNSVEGKNTLAAKAVQLIEICESRSLPLQNSWRGHRSLTVQFACVLWICEVPQAILLGVLQGYRVLGSVLHNISLCIT